MPEKEMDQPAPSRSWPDKVFALTVDEVAARLNCHRNTATALIESGEIGARKVKSVWRVALASLEEFLAVRENQDGKSQDGPPEKEGHPLNQRLREEPDLIDKVKGHSKS